MSKPKKFTIELTEGFELITHATKNDLGAVVVHSQGAFKELLLIVPPGKHTIEVGRFTANATGGIDGYQVFPLFGKISGLPPGEPSLVTKTFTVKVTPSKSTGRYAVLRVVSLGGGHTGGFPSTKPKPEFA